jgi:hypothetical protein
VIYRQPSIHRQFTVMAAFTANRHALYIRACRLAVTVLPGYLRSQLRYLLD